MKDTFDTLMEQEKPVLTEAEQALLFERIEAAVQRQEDSTVSPYATIIFTKKIAVSLFALLFVLTSTGTVLASDAAKPGEILFSIERAHEEVQLKLSSEEKRRQLQEKFASERLSELGEIYEEEKYDSLNPRVVETVTFVKKYVDDIEDESIRKMLHEALEQQFRESDDDDNDEVDIEVRGDDSRLKIEDDKIEYRDEQQRVEIRDDGEVRIKYEDEDSSYEYREDKQRDDDEVSIKKFEVRVEEGRAEVRLEYGGAKQEYNTYFSSEEALVVEAAGRTGLPIEVLLQSLDIEYKD